MYWQELTTGIYPWDVHDEGIETILDNLQETGCNSAYMVALMHYEKRPFRHPYYDHNPRRKRYLAEDSRCYWLIDEIEYAHSPIKPLGSDREFLKGVDWLDVMSTAMRKRGMKMGVEISHTPLDSTRGAGEFVDHTQKGIYGAAPLHPAYYSAGHLCWNSPVAREYVCCIARDLVRNHDVDFLQTCSMPFTSGTATNHSVLGILLGGCFCDHCAQAARIQGLDWDSMIEQMRPIADMLTLRSLEGAEDLELLEKGGSSDVMLLLENPSVYRWLKFRCDSFTAFVRQLSEAAHGVRPEIEFRMNTCWRTPERQGLDLKSIGPHIDSIRMMDYLEQFGPADDLLDRKTRWLADVRRQVGEDKPIIGGIAPRGDATPQIIKESIKRLAHEGVDGLSFGFYDCAPMANLRAIREGVEEAGVVLRPTAG